jgi:cytochrome c-type biogenesis protein
MDFFTGVALLGGLASFYSPCVLPMIPIYIGNLGGRSFTQVGVHRSFIIRSVIFLHGLAFVAGFSLIFIIEGLGFSLLGEFLAQYHAWIGRAAGIFIMIMGMHVSGFINLDGLNYEFKPSLKASENKNSITSFFMGIVFAVGWTPCIGPILGSLLVFSLQGASLYKGVIYLIAYSAGLALPFLSACWVLENTSSWLPGKKHLMVIFEKTMGFVLILTGILLVMGVYAGLIQTMANIKLG